MSSVGHYGPPLNLENFKDSLDILKGVFTKDKTITKSTEWTEKDIEEYGEIVGIGECKHYQELEDIENDVLDLVIAITSEEWDRIFNATKVSMKRHAGLTALVGELISARRKLVERVS